MAPSSERISKVLEDERLWVYRDFVKEKLRNRERYWRHLSDLPTSVGKESSSSCWVVPDGIIWRKYLSLLTYLIKESQCNLLLLESAVDLMDYRSISPVVECENDTWQPEKPAPQERSKISKLAIHFPRKVFPFCDLSVREEDHDEFDMLDYASISIADRSQHSLMRTAGLLQKKIGNQKIMIVSTEDLRSRYPAEDGCRLFQMDDFIKELLSLHTNLDQQVLMNLKRSCEEEYKVRNIAQSNSAESKNSEHLSEDQIREGLKCKTLFKGRLEVSKHNPKEGTVATSDGGTYFIDHKLGYFNRAFHHDVVVIQVLPKAEWRSPVGKRRLVHHRDDDDDDTGATSFEVDSTPPVPSARVVAIAESSRRRFVGTMVDSPMNDESACLVIPMDIRIPKIRIRTNTWNRFVGQRLLIQVDSWEIDSKYPAGHCHEIIGPIGDLETEISCLLYEHELHLEPFSAGALACLPSEGRNWKIPQEEIEKRRDLRDSHRIFSVDPPGCQDIDDTMHARELSNGDIEIGVHIADVTYFVPHNSPLDLEAQVRGTTFYLVDRRFDMLPSLLSSDLCSLHGATDRLAVSTIWTFSRDFKEVKSFWYGRTVIHNCQAMTYGQAHNIIHDQPPDDGAIPPPLTAGAPVDRANVKDLKKDLMILTQLARKLRKDREDIGGAVDLSSGDQGNELKFTLDKDNNPIKVTAKKQMEIHNTIAELMILSNTWVAKTIYNKSPDSALLRNHRTVEDSRFEDLKAVLDAGKIAFDGKDNMALANSLKAAETATKSNSTMQSLFQSLATRAMSEAQYVCTGQVSQDQLSHYGLGLEKYTHFTSPIRRYADVVVHKQLLASAAPSKNRDAFIEDGDSNGEPSLIPESKTISILAGEGIRTRDQTVETSDDLLSIGNSAVAESQQSQMIDPHQKVTTTVYSPRLVAKICDTLNRQNRMAKLSSMECQHLFLSIYFRKNVEVTKAVVVDLRANGFWVYIPLFDMRAPVYLSDISGRVQIDPRLLGLDESAGEDPTLAFAASPYARMIPSSDCTLVESPDKHLRVTAPAAKSPYYVRVLDVVTVQISCDSWDVRARIPMPKIHLIADSSGPKISFNAHDQASKSTITSSTLQEGGTNEGAVPPNVQEESTSMYSELGKLETPPVILDFPFSSNTRTMKLDASRTSIIPGRIVFGGFRNPDTRSAMQEASIEEAAESAELRRAQAVAGMARSNEYDTTRRIEKDVTSRMQKLQANKRNTRKGKGK